MRLPRLIAITDLERWSAARTLEVFATLARSAEPGSVAVQLRGPKQTTRRLYELGLELGAISRATGQLLIVNDRLDLARLLGADGVHLGEASVASAEARALGPFRWIFRACHAPEAVDRIDADALVLSPILAPRKGAPALGLGAVEQVSRALGERGSGAVFALGGVTPETAAACLAAGAAGVAAMAGVFGSSEPDDWVQALAIARNSREDGS